MANSCYFEMRATGSISFIIALEETFQKNQFYRIEKYSNLPAEKTSTDGIYKKDFVGSCAWSIFDAFTNDSPQCTSLSEISKEGVVEIFGDASGEHEHLIYAFGKEVISEVTDYTELFVETTVEALNEEYETNFTENDVDEEGNVTKGGFVWKFTEAEWAFVNESFTFTNAKKRN